MTGRRCQLRHLGRQDQTSLPAAAKIGSVGVRHAAMAKLDKKSNAGISAYIKAAHTTQPTAMTGPML